MPQGVKSDLTYAEKYEANIKKGIEYKRYRRLTDPEYVKREKEYNRLYHQRIKETGIKARLEKKIQDEQK